MSKNLNTKKRIAFISTLCVLIVSVVALCFVALESHKSSAVSGSWDSYVSVCDEKDSANYYKITSAGQLAYINANASTYFGDNYKFRLYANINMSAHFWKPNNSCSFKGTFDGNGYTISGITMEGNSYNTNSSFANAGMFAKIDGAKISNLYLENFKIYGYECAGALAGISENASEISFIKVIGNGTVIAAVNNTSNTETKRCAGGIIGKKTNSSGKISRIKNCSINSGNIYVNNRYISSNINDINNICYAGGIVGYNENGGVMQCISYATTVHSYKSYSVERYTRAYAYAIYIGGIVGYTDNGRAEECYNTSLVDAGTLSATFNAHYKYLYVGGVVGYLSRSIVRYCYNTGSVCGIVKEKQTTTSQLSDVIAYNEPCSIWGLTKDTKKTITYYPCYVGGIVGGISASSCSISHCYNTGVIENYSPKSTTIYTYSYFCNLYGTDGACYDYVLFYSSIDGEMITKHSICGMSVSSSYITNCYSRSNIYDGFIQQFKSLLLQGPEYNINDLNHFRNRNIDDFSWDETCWVGNANGSSWLNYCLNGDRYDKSSEVSTTNTRSNNLRVCINQTFSNDMYGFYIDTNNNKITLGTKSYSSERNWSGKYKSYYNKDIPLKTISLPSVTDDATVGISVGSGKLDSSYYAVDSKINNGLPHLKCFYWQDSASIG